MCWLQVGNAQGRNISEGTANVVEDDRWHMVSGSVAGLYADCMQTVCRLIVLDCSVVYGVLVCILVPNAAHSLSISWHPMHL